MSNVWVHTQIIFISFLKEFHISQTKKKKYSQSKSKDPTSHGVNAAHTSGHHGVISGSIKLQITKMGWLLVHNFHTKFHENQFKVPYFTDYKTHFFLQKIASKIQVRLILEINTKMSSV
jgi:hypothetical protein